MNDARTYRSRLTLVCALIFATGALWGASAYAVDPTSLEPAEGYTPGTLTVEEEVAHDHYKKYETTPETTVEYECTEHCLVGASVPVKVEKDEATHIGNADAHVKYTFNPDAAHGPVAAVTAAVEAPTADQAKGVGGEVALRLSQKVGGAESKHQVHLQASEAYANDVEKGERHAHYTALAGYTYQASPSTSLVADISHEQLSERHKYADVLEVGVKEEVGDHMTLALGGGPGFGPDSPEWRLQAGVGFQFNLGKRH